MSSTHAPGVRSSMPRPQTPRRPTDDDPLRRTPPGSPRPRRPGRTTPTPTRPRRSRSTPSPSRADRAAAAAVAAGTGWSASSSSSSSRSSWRRRARDRADRAPARRRRRGHDPRRGQPGGAPAPVRQGHRRARTSVRALTTPASTDPAQVEFLVEEGDTAQSIADAARGRGPARGPPRVRVHRDRPRADRRAPAGHVHPAQEHDPGPARQRAARTADGQVRRHRAADRAAPRADHRQAPDAAADDGPAGVLRAGQVAAGVARSPTIRGSRRSSRTRRRARRSRASCGRRPTACSPTRRPRSSSG